MDAGLLSNTTDRHTQLNSCRDKALHPTAHCNASHAVPLRVEGHVYATMVPCLSTPYQRRAFLKLKAGYIQGLRETGTKKSEFSKALTADEISESKKAFPTFLKMIGDLHRSGLQFLTGTDSPAVPYCFAGFSVHDELALFVEAGLTPMEALQTATRNPAKYLGLLDSSNCRAGQIADLVLLTPPATDS